MNLVNMRERFTEHVSDLASDLTDADVDAYLNRAYRYVIPTDVGGEFNEVIWFLVTQPQVDTYEYAANVIAPNGEAAFINSHYLTTDPASLTSLDTTFLTTETNRAVFEYADRLSLTSLGRPTAVLFYGRTAILSPVPDSYYIVKIPVRGGPSADLNTTGIANDLHAMATVTAAATEFLVEAEDADGVNRESALYQSYIKHLHVMAQARPNSRRWRRSF